jgi:RNA polymerase sigma factor (sigma-70 family)
MAGLQGGTVRQLLQDLAARGQSDGQLLARFQGDRDEAAFAALVRRHGPMVLGVCRRVLGDWHHAEDAWQATFLTLARKAAAVRRGDALAAWLHGVAYRVAAKARGRLGRRRDRAALPADVPAAEGPGNDLAEVLDAEVRRLPAPYRAAVVACYLRGRTVDQAARDLGCPRGTLASRLARARALLRQRLARRGVGLPALALTALLPEPAPAVPPRLTAAVLRAAAIPAAAGAGWLVGLLTLLLGGGLLMGLVLAPAAGRPGAPGTAVAAVQGRPAPDPVRDAITNGVAFLQSAAKGGTWEPKGASGQTGGYTALAALALLEAGVKPDSPAVAPGLAYLRTLPPASTYVVGLQTAVLARADPRKDRDLLERNVTWLVKTAVRDGQSRLMGWTYLSQGGRADNSNTQYAVLGLEAAARAGITVPAPIWDDLYTFYRNSQLPTGGWGYQAIPGGGGLPDTLNMTCAGAAGLAVATVQARQRPDEKAQALALKRIGELCPVKKTSFYYCGLYGLGRAGRLNGVDHFIHDGKPLPWYRLGADELVRTQQRDGSWHGDNALDGNDVIATSFALLFLCGGR